MASQLQERVGLAAAMGLGALFLSLEACEPGREAARVERPLVVDDQISDDFTTDLGFEIRLERARLAVADFQFATQGELHTATILPKIGRWLVAPAYAHPGHYEGAEVIGEARGRFVIDWFEEGGRQLALATLIVSEYSSGNFTLTRAKSEDGLEEDDPLVGHTALLSGRVRDGDGETSFQFVVDSPEDRQLVGAPFAATIREEEEGEVRFQLLPEDELGGSTLFDQIDFAALDADGDGQIEVGPSSTGDAEIDAYNQLRRALQTHDHYRFTWRRTTSASQGGSS